MYDYVCTFTFNPLQKSCLDLHIMTVRYSYDGVSAFRDGFWIDKCFRFTKGSKGVYWISPSQIQYIQKVKKDGNRQ
jgi:hypothetical protein